MGQVIAILSGKGGTGKSVLCAGLADQLAGAGKRVLVVDCCVGLPQMELYLGMADCGALSFLEVCRGEYTLAQAGTHPIRDGLRLLTAPYRLHGPWHDGFAAMLDQARAEFDFVLLDCPPGPEPGIFGRLCDLALLVAVPQAPCVRCAAVVGEELDKMGKQQSFLLVNRVKKRLFHTPEITVDDIMDQTGLPLMGLVPEDPELSLAVETSRPITGDIGRGAGPALRAIAQRLMGSTVPLTIH